jgi:pimeloyl-ACP methyl ester carboxylesterase
VRLAAAALLAATLAAAGCGGGHRQKAPTATLSGAHPCVRPLHVNCATLTVPLDHAGRVPGQLRLRVAVSGPRAAPRGVLLFLAGGPGQPGVPFIARVQLKLATALRGYRLVMLDQRGTGHAALRCPALQRAAGASDLAVPPLSAVNKCAAELAPKRRFFTSADVVADLDMLRAALGVDRWTLDGVSYGTFVAEHYALAHPQHVRRLVLDSVVPQEGINPFQLETIHAVPRVLRSACAERHCATDPVADLAAVVRARHDGPALLDTLVTLSIADPTYRAVPRALSEARAGRPARLDRLVAGVHRGDLVPAAFLSQGLHASTLCEDYLQPWGGPAVPVVARQQAIRARAARLTLADVWPFDIATATGNGELITCENWPPVSVGVPSPGEAGAHLPNIPVLLLAGDRDLSTPMVWAEGEAGHAAQGNLVLVRGAGHSVQLRAKDPAGRTALIQFLSRGSG